MIVPIFRNRQHRLHRRFKVPLIDGGATATAAAVGLCLFMHLLRAQRRFYALALVEPSVDQGHAQCQDGDGPLSLGASQRQGQ